MKKIYMINYDLKNPGQQYSELYSQIKSTDYCHVLDSCWLVYTSENATSLYNRLSPYLANNDNILISNFGTEYYGYLPTQVWDWIRQHSYAYSA